MNYSKYYLLQQDVLSLAIVFGNYPTLAKHANITHNIPIGNRDMDKTRKKIKYVFPPLITILLFSIILAVKGIYPFGTNTIDYYDMAQQVAPFYYHIYDVLHGTKGLFFDWYTALGTGMTTVSAGSLLSPLNIFFLFIRRENLLQSLSVFTGIKLMFMSLSMYFYVTKTHTKAPESFRQIAAVSYAFCGFVLLNYTISPWLDIAAIFPILMYFYDRVISEGKIIGYTITLALTAIMSYYEGIMILMFLFMYMGLLIIRGYVFDKDKELNNHVMELGVGTVIGLLLSAFITVPQLIQTLGTARFQNGTQSEGVLASYMEILSHVKGDYSTRWWTLLGVSFATAVIMTGLIRFRKDRRLVFTTISMLVIVLAELFVESTNLMMHFGSYVHYPIRNGYIICFVFGYLMCEFAGRLYGDPDGQEQKSYAAFITVPVTVIGFALFAMWLGSNRGMLFCNVLHVTAAMMAGALIYYLIVLKFKYTLSWGIIACEILCYGLLLFGQPDFVLGYAEASEQSNDYIYMCNRLQEAFDLEPERLHRIKNPDESLNANYGFVLRQPALSCWTAMISSEEQIGAAKWGYSYQYTRLLDAGGTAFSDALLGIDKVISRVPLDEKLYEPVDKAEDYTLYRPKYTLSFGILINDVDELNWEISDTVEIHNKMYHAMTDDKDDIAKWLVKGSDEELITLNITDPTALYLLGAGGDKDERNYTFELIRESKETEIISVPDIGAPENTGYPAYFNNNALCFGSFENETITLKVTKDPENGADFPIDIMGLDLNKLESICRQYEKPATGDMKAGRSSLTFTVDNRNESANAILLPLAYDTGWTATVNGQAVDICNQAGLFTKVPLATGPNIIDMQYIPLGMKQGVIVSITALILLAIYVVIARKHAAKINKKADKLLSKLYTAAFTTVFLLVYAIPMAYLLYELCTGIIL